MVIGCTLASTVTLNGSTTDVTGLCTSGNTVGGVDGSTRGRVVYLAAIRRELAIRRLRGSVRTSMESDQVDQVGVG